MVCKVLGKIRYVQYKVPIMQDGIRSQQTEKRREKEKLKRRNRMKERVGKTGSHGEHAVDTVRGFLLIWIMVTCYY